MELTDGPVKDFPLLWKVYDHIVAHPEEWDQSMWFRKNNKRSCGTSYCFAGFVVHMTRPDLTPEFCVVDDGSDVMTAYYVYDEEGNTFSVSEVAQNALGLTHEEQDSLFNATNSLVEIRNVIAEWETNEYV